MYEKIHKIINKAVKDELQRFDCRKTYDILDVYFCSLEHIHAEIESIDLCTLRSELLVAIMEKKRLLSVNDKNKIVILFEKNQKEIQKKNWEYMHYKSNWDEKICKPIV